MSHKEYLAVLCFDQHEYTPSPKSIELKSRDNRSQSSGQSEDPVIDSDRVMDDVLPSPWALVLKERSVRSVVCEYLRKKITERFRNDSVPQNMSIAVYGAGEDPAVFKKQTKDQVLCVETHTMSDLNPHIGESDISMVAFSLKLQRTFDLEKIVISTVDTDLVAIMLLNLSKQPPGGNFRMYVDLYHFRKGVGRISTVIDIQRLGNEIQLKNSTSILDYVLATMLQVSFWNHLMILSMARPIDRIFLKKNFRCPLPRKCPAGIFFFDVRADVRVENCSLKISKTSKISFRHEHRRFFG